MLSLRCGEILQTASHPQFPFKSTGATMKVAISYKDVEKHQPAEKEVARFASKLSRLLKTYDPDLLQLRGAFSQNPRNGEFIFSANLALPAGTLQDRKSTRLNSSHVEISYAVFCLKKKKKT